MNIFFLSLFVYVQSLNLVELSNHTQYFKSIYLPPPIFINKEFRNYSVFRSPGIKTYDLKQVPEICSSIHLILLQENPKFWNNSFIPNPCEIYFCRNTTRAQDMDIHYGIHRYCIQCHQTINQRFNATNRNCSNFDYNHCNGVCSNSSRCIYFKKDLNLCYNFQRNQFYHKEDYTHMYLTDYIYDRYNAYLMFFGTLFLLIFTTFTLFIPEIHQIRLILSDQIYNWNEKLTIVFGLKSQTILILIFAEFIFIPFSILDIISFTNNELIYYSQYLTLIFLFLEFNSLITLWKFICNLTEQGSLNGKLSIKEK